MYGNGSYHSSNSNNEWPEHGLGAFRLNNSIAIYCTIWYFLLGGEDGRASCVSGDYIVPCHPPFGLLRLIDPGPNVRLMVHPRHPGSSGGRRSSVTQVSQLGISFVIIIIMTVMRLDNWRLRRQTAWTEHISSLLPPCTFTPIPSLHDTSLNSFGLVLPTWVSSTLILRTYIPSAVLFCTFFCTSSQGH